MDLVLEIQIRIEPCPKICFHSDRSKFNAPYDKASNIYFGKLLFRTNQNELSFVVIKFKLIRMHPRTNVRYTAFHGNDCICLIIS